ncbi:zinc-finger homeodomain protein 2-like [Momordica charantia]|uniref:Zinc-finger homeodomain protein 2-like n=1 Tax=Momordica charantia TaxID=3673 RepID=A0A6J1C4L4_MOMCH|nr:zinc-finger homeodomain protein 2-like [Momordica charantia]
MELEDHEERMQQVDLDLDLEAVITTKPLLRNHNPPHAPRLNKNPTPVQTNLPTYRECLKNHAVALGGHALDGCGEFMPAGPDGSLDALKCAACTCHRNFHRKDAPLISYSRAPAGYLHVAPERRMLALPAPAEMGRKRMRTKFTEEQKEKMLGMAEKLEWRIEKEDEAAVAEFCNAIGVKRRVLKVWMHNNKNTFRKDQHDHTKFSSPIN